jgi:hypothetical protein
MSAESAVLTVLSNALVQMALLAGVAWAGERLARDAPARLRHRLWWLALSAALALPLFSLARRLRRPRASRSRTGRRPARRRQPRRPTPGRS